MQPDIYSRNGFPPPYSPPDYGEDVDTGVTGQRGGLESRVLDQENGSGSDELTISPALLYVPTPRGHHVLNVKRSVELSLQDIPPRKRRGQLLAGIKKAIEEAPQQRVFGNFDYGAYAAKATVTVKNVA